MPFHEGEPRLLQENGMSSNLLDHAFGFRQYRCTRTTTAAGVLSLHLEQDPQHDRCSNCQSPDVTR